VFVSRAKKKAAPTLPGGRVQLKYTAAQITNLASQRPDLFRSIPPYEHLVDDDEGIFTLTVPEDVGAALSALDPSVKREPVPEQVELFRARYVMAQTPNPHGAGTLLDAAIAAIAAIPNTAERTLATEGINRANALSRHGRLVTTIASTLGLDDSALDNLFREANALDV
jgi:hypothetical protein